MSVAVVLGFGGWYLIGSSVHRTPTGASAPVASSSAPGPSGAEAPAGPEPTPTPQAQPVLPPSGAGADVAPPAAETSKEPPQEAASAPGRLLVRSTPSGARVFVDDQEYGVTPATIRDLALRTHRVRVIRDEYISEERRVSITSATPAQSIAFELDEPHATPPSGPPTSALAPTGTLGGALSVDLHPVGANVFIDDQPVGKTPVSLLQIGAGSHVVRLELNAYRGWSSSVRVVPGGRNRVTASLEEENPPEPTASLNHY